MMLSSRIKYSYIRFLLLSVYEEIARQYPRYYGMHILKQILVDSFSDSEDISKKIFVINKIRGLENVAAYLIFVLKKLEAGLIKYDTVLNNLLDDKQFLIREVVNFFESYRGILEQTEDSAKENTALKVPEGLLTLEDLEVNKVGKEFIKESYEETTELELIKNEIHTDEELAFILPGEEIEGNSEKEKESQQIKIEEKEKEETSKETKRDYEGKEVQSIEPAEEKREQHTLDGKEMLENTIEEVSEEKEQEKINSLYIEFEEKMSSRNRKLKEALNSLFNEDLQQENDDVVENIIALTMEMELYSAQLTFEVIPSLYSIIKDFFACYQKGAIKQLNDNDLKTFLNYLELIETLVKGEDLTPFENVIPSIETFKKRITDLKSVQQEIEKDIKTIDLEREDNSFNLEEQELNNGKEESYRNIRENILYIENIFNSLEQIESKYKIYEALTSLSKIFPQLKEIVLESNRLNQIDIARLADATYIFIKFVQNYRINPFQKEVTEVLKYIIYNFKRLYLGKPSEDLNLFIKYLNNPTKIFENNGTK